MNGAPMPPAPTGPNPPMPGAPPPPPASCPKCHAPVGPSDRFCPGCGAPLSDPSAPRPVDIRTSVEADRGVLKKLQLLIPGFRGYRQGEDLREADSVLRLQVADKIRAASNLLTQRRQALSTAGKYDGLVELAQALSDLQRLEGEIRHAEQGYTGISPALRVNTTGQDKLYEYDYGFVQAAVDLENAAASLSDPSTDPGPAIAALRPMVTRLEQAFRARIQVIQGVRV